MDDDRKAVPAMLRMKSKKKKKKKKKTKSCTPFIVTWPLSQGAHIIQKDEISRQAHQEEKTRDGKQLP